MIGTPAPTMPLGVPEAQRSAHSTVTAPRLRPRSQYVKKRTAFRAFPALLLDLQGSMNFSTSSDTRQMDEDGGGDLGHQIVLCDSTSFRPTSTTKETGSGANDHKRIINVCLKYLWSYICVRRK